jgi:hypothetical protein
MALLTEILLYRGALVNMPVLPSGMPAFATDTGELFVGNGIANVKIGSARVSDGNVGDLTISAGGTVYTVNNAVITLAKLANITSHRLIGRTAAGAGVPAEISITDALAWISTTSGSMLWYDGTTWAALAAPSQGQVLGAAVISGVPTPFWFFPATILIKELQTSGTNGGTFTAGAWRTRTLNTVQNDTQGFVSLNSNQILLPAFNWRVSARAPAANCGNHQCRLQNVSAGTTVAMGSNSYGNPAGVQSDSVVDACFSSNGSDLYELQHQCQITVANVGFGGPNSFGGEVYSTVLLERLF